jgi:hypothetical protein
MSNPDLAKLRANAAAAAADPTTTASMVAVFTELVRVIDAYQPPPITTTPSNYVAITQHTATTDTITITWATTTETLGFNVSRTGTDNTGHGPWSGNVAPAVRSFTFEKLTPATTYNVTVQGINSGLTASAAVTTSPAATTPTNPDPPAAGKVTWSSGCWANQDASRATAFEKQRGQKLGNITVFTTRNNWDTMLNASLWRSGIPTGFTGDLIIKLPLWPGNGSINSFGTKTQWQTLASQIAATDSDAWICLGWEMNLPSWAHKLTNANASQWINVYRAVVGWMLTAAPNLRFAWNPNAGGDQTGGDQRKAFQALKSLHEAYVLDSYDSWPALTTGTIHYHFTAAGFIGESYAYAINNGVKFGLSEWGVASGTQWNGNQGGDNPFYITTFMDFLKRCELTKTGSIAFDSYFSEPAAYLKSDWASNPKAAAAYAAEFK